MELYRIKKETDAGPTWMINIVFDDPDGTSASWTPNKQYGFLLDLRTANYALEKLNDSSYSMDRDY